MLFEAPNKTNISYRIPSTTLDTRAVFGQVMGLVAVTFGFVALGAFITRNITGGGGLLFFIIALGCIFGLHSAEAKGREQLAIVLLFGLGLSMGMAVGPAVAYYASAQPDVVAEAAGATAGFIGIMGAAGWATKQNLSAYWRFFFWALIGLIAFGLITLFISVPGGNLIYCILGLVIFAFITALDFQRLRTRNILGPVSIAASIFLDIFNVFLFFLQILGGGGSRRA